MDVIPRQLDAVAVAIVCCIVIATCSAATPAPTLGPATTHYDFNVSVAQRAPDCFGEQYFSHRMLPSAACCPQNLTSWVTLISACAEKGVLVVNGEFNKLIEVVQGNILEARYRSYP